MAVRKKGVFFISPAQNVSAMLRTQACALKFLRPVHSRVGLKNFGKDCTSAVKGVEFVLLSLLK